jgi:hypothetical protein
MPVKTLRSVEEIASEPEVLFQIRGEIEERFGSQEEAVRDSLAPALAICFFAIDNPPV